MKNGFTLLELIVVIIIIGILATLGFTQYSMVIEKGRTSEAKAMLGAIRKIEIGYNLENATYTTAANLPIGFPSACTGTHYFSYSITPSSSTATATRCGPGAGGKSPDGSAYSITINFDTGVWSGTTGYI